MSAKKSLKEKTNEVIADRMFGKAIADYGETSKRKVLVVTEFDNRAEIVVSSKIAKKLEKRPGLVKALKELFELENDSEDEDYELLSDKSFYLPKLSVPFKNVEQGWTYDVVIDQATLYLNILGYGKGGTKSLVDTKFKSAEKPVWWDDSNNFAKYSAPSKAKMKVNEDVIESILKHHGYDPETHCEFSEPIKKKNRKMAKKKGKHILGESLIEDDPAILDLRVDKNDNSNNHEVTDEDEDEDADEDEDSSEGSDNSNGNIADYVVPKKRTKKELAKPKLSWFEENVIQKNIKEREDFAKKLGIDTIADELRKTAKK